MKNYSKFAKKLLVFLAVVAIALVATTFVACVDKPQSGWLAGLELPTLAANEMAVIVKNGDKDYDSYVVTLGADGTNAQTVEDVINYLHDERGLYVDWQDSGYGKFLNAIGGAVPQSGQWITVLTSDTRYQDVASAYSVTYEVDGVTLVSANVGVSGMQVNSGVVVYFEVAG